MVNQTTTGVMPVRTLTYKMKGFRRDDSWDGCRPLPDIVIERCDNVVGIHFDGGENGVFVSSVVPGTLTATSLLSPLIHPILELPFFPRQMAIFLYPKQQSLFFPRAPRSVDSSGDITISLCVSFQTHHIRHTHQKLRFSCSKSICKHWEPIAIAS